MPSNIAATAIPPFHVAVIMDGNGRWAAARRLPRSEGHRAGVEALKRIVEVAPSLGISALTVYAFSADNWRRPLHEVSALMSLLRGYLKDEVTRLAENRIRLQVIGRRDRLPTGIPQLIERAECATSSGDALTLRIALDYSSRDAILAAAVECGAHPTREAMMQKLCCDIPDVDLLIRTSGEQRLSDFLLWESAYAEFCFTERLWPDFSSEDLAMAVAAFKRRHRRFGGLTPNNFPEDTDTAISVRANQPIAGCA
ncbi:MAG: di-trans,poly-cis-decaprenylcistransferase [Hyphomicrobiaceae bacterium]|nr:di-trans,poly-cis-decaprenylcistransferase [Hyphomicrobiaceae bacterium]